VREWDLEWARKTGVGLEVWKDPVSAAWSVAAWDGRRAWKKEMR
jgi:hypothetical protein